MMSKCRLETTFQACQLQVLSVQELWKWLRKVIIIQFFLYRFMLHESF